MLIVMISFPQSKVSHKRQVFQSWCSDPNSKRVVVVIFENSEIIKIRMLNRKSRIRQTTPLQQPSKWPKLDIANYEGDLTTENSPQIDLMSTKESKYHLSLLDAMGNEKIWRSTMQQLGSPNSGRKVLRYLNLCRLKKTQMIYLYKRAAKKILREPKEKNCFAKVTKDNMIQRK